MVLREGRHIVNKCMQSGGEGGGGAACRTMIYILVCAHMHDSAWGVERGGDAKCIFVIWQAG